MHILLNKKIIIIPIVIIAVIIFSSLSSNESKDKSDEIFHVTLANPNLYVNGLYTDEVTLDQGEYFFRFVPNGSSPKELTIELNSDSFEFSEDFQLKGTSHQTGISEYFTWDYDGEKNIMISENQKFSIIIDPNGETLGSVSVYIVEK